MVVCSICGRTLDATETAVPKYGKGMNQAFAVQATICNTCEARYPHAFTQKEK